MAEESDHFSLRWNNFQSNLASGFHALLLDEALVDVTLAAGGKFIQAHKIVLSVCSPYFQELFKVNPCKHPIVILKDVSYQDLNAILEFMYKGEVNVRQEELEDFLKTAETLQIKGLTEDSSPDDHSNMLSIADSPPPTHRTKERGKRHSVPLPQVQERSRSTRSPLPAYPTKRSRVESSPGASILPVPSGSSVVPLPSGSSIMPVPSGSSILPVPSGSSILPVPSGSSMVSVPSGSSILPLSSGSSLRPVPSGSSILPVSVPSGSQGKAIPITEFINVTKSEPIDLDSDLEEVDDKTDTMMKLLQGETSLTHQDDTDSHQSAYDNSLSHMDSNQSLMDNSQGANQSHMDPGQSNLNISQGMFAGIGGSSHNLSLDTSQEGSQAVDSRGSPIHCCTQCGKKLCSESSLRRHIASVHTVTKTADCHMCGKVFKNMNSLLTHLNGFHKSFSYPE